MTINQGPHWKKEVEKKEYPVLTETIESDVAIIGGGITGVLCAYVLAKQGKKIVLIEKKELGKVATGHTTAFITQIIDTNLQDLIRVFGKDTARAIIDSHGKAISLIEAIIETEKIDCEFTRCSNYIYARTVEETKKLLAEYTAGKELGLLMRYAEENNLGFDTKAYIEVKRQAKFHPMKFLRALAEICEREGVRIFEGTEAMDISTSPTLSVNTEQGSVNASWIIAATYEPFKQPLGLFFKKGLYSSYVLKLDVPKQTFKEGTYEDLMNPYHYFRIDKKGNHDQMIIGGEDHRRDIPIDKEKNYSALEEYVRTTFPGLRYTITDRWEGPILEPSDGLAFIGRHKHPNILYAMGFSGNGMTYSAIAALILSNIILQKENPWFPIYRADRVPSSTSLLVKARDYFGELWNGAIKNFFRSKT